MGVLEEEIEALEARISELEFELKGANAVIAEIERLLPGWERYRDLADALAVRLKRERMAF